MDKYKDNGIILAKMGVIHLPKEVMRMAESNPELLNAVYREISEKLGMNTAMIIYQMFKGQQISFPTRFFNPAMIQQAIIQEYDEYNYSEKTVRRIIKESVDNQAKE